MFSLKIRTYQEVIEHDVVQHSIRVAELAYKMSKISRIGVPEEIATAGVYHDLGKILIIDVIGKPGLLSDSEREMVKMHPFYSAYMLKNIRTSSNTLNLITTHHAYPDGRGYPVLEFVNREQLILQSADMYDALTSERIYRKKPRREGWKEILLEHRFPNFVIDLLETAVSEESSISFDVFKSKLLRIVNNFQVRRL